METNHIRAEVADRMDRVRALLRRHDLAGMILYGDAAHSGNLRYLTNYTPAAGPAVLVVRGDGERILLLSFDWEVARVREASGVARIEAGADLPNLLKRSLNELSLRDAPLGLVGAGTIPHGLYLALAGQGTRPEPVDLDTEFAEFRLIKSRLEQEMLRRAAAATDTAIAMVLSEVRAGMTEREVAARADYAMRRVGGDAKSFPAIIASGPNAERPVSLPGERQLERGDLVFMDVGAVCEGYCADVTRTFVVGPPSQRQREVYDIVSQALTAATKVVQPGVPVADVHRSAVRVLDQYDLARYFPVRVGHGIGLETSLEAPDLRVDEMPLRTGMTFCIEPGVYIPGFGGIRIEDDVIVGPAGAEVISRASRELVAV